MNIENIMEAKFSHYFVHGKHQNGKVDVVSTTIDPVVTVSENQADILIQDRKELLTMLLKFGRALNDIAPEEFDKLWYGIEHKLKFVDESKN